MGPLPIDSASPLPAATSQELSPRQEIERRLSSIIASEERPASSEPVSKEALVQPIEQINAALRPRGLEFELSDTSSRVITRVVDRETGDIIREIPPEEVLAVAERLDELQGKLISLEA